MLEVKQMQKTPELAGQQGLIRLYFRVELMVLGNQLGAGRPCSQAKAPILDQCSLRRVHRQTAGRVQNALMPHSVRPHKPEGMKPDAPAAAAAAAAGQARHALFAVDTS